MWIRIDDQMARHPKLLSVSRDARWVHLAGMCYAGEYLTDGFVPRRVALQIAIEDEGDNPMALIAELLKARIWEQVEGGYQIHDYLDYNPSREEVEAEREKERERRDRLRGRAGRDSDTGRYSGTTGGTPPGTTPGTPPGTTPGTPPGTTPGTPPGTTPGTPPGTTTRCPAVPVPVPVPVPNPKTGGLPSGGGTSTRADVDNSEPGRRPLRASAPGKPQTRATGPPEQLTDEQGEILDRLRAKLERRFPREVQRIQQAVVTCIGRGEPFGALQRALEHAVVHCRDNPAAYIDRVVRVEGPNVDAERSQVQAGGFKQAMDGLGLRSLAEMAARAAAAAPHPEPIP